MAEPDNLTDALQESILAALIFDHEHGAAIAAQLRPENFDQPYREIAEKVLDYRAKFRKPPGRVHLEDLFARVLQKNAKPTRVGRILHALAALEEGLNGEYVASQVQDYVRKHQMKGAIFAAAERYDQGGPELLPDVENLLQQALRLRAETMDSGLFLNEARALEFLDARDSSTTIPIGIKQLDDLGLGMELTEMLLFIAPKGRGKSWFCVHCGKQGLKHQVRVLHISLEMRESIIAGRYFQSIFGGARRDEDLLCSVLELDEHEKFAAFARTRRFRPQLHWHHPKIREMLRRRMTKWGTRLGNIVIKQFATGQLTIAALNSYLDILELKHKFVPNILIVDYPDLMRQQYGEPRHSLRQTFIDLRGILVQRKLAGVMPTQGNRSSLDARIVRPGMVAEDVSKIQTADAVMTLSSTKEERSRGLARLYLAHSRNTVDGKLLLITQSYPTGQFVLQSAYHDNEEYKAAMRAAGAEGGELNDED